MAGYLKQSIPTLLMALFLLMGSKVVCAAPISSISMVNKGVISRVLSIATYESEAGMTINILGDGEIPDYKTKTIDSPPKIFVDIFCTAQKLETIVIAHESSILESIRVGHHPRKIRVVLDIKKTVMPDFTTKSNGTELTVFLKSEAISAPKSERPNGVYDAKTGNSLSEKKEPENAPPDNRRPAPVFFSKEQPVIEKALPLSPIPIEQNIEAPVETIREEVRTSEISKVVEMPQAPPEDSLMKNVPDDGQDDTAVFKKGLEAYSGQDWAKAVETFTHFIKTYPAGRYTERAYFLLAKAYDKSHLESRSDHFKEIKKHYEDAAYKFPASEYGADAFLGIGSLCFKTGSYYEAL
ncbi:MAG: AMIN domain-containing protein, partial [Proteobacteria bacterium]|nr:AMIN domain-containing protein [Pseudomonadota bacterium]